ncbi:MAG: putative thiamine biosynthesis protein [Alphaproteobacteria bacterium MarineAlpha9_Bin3]|nr:MAG: putative thiamine biosynthesis protein [Alphaproteobacteria bacterium MarineAlpha9_Bin3]|tara:strand:- start:12201 stop:13148 length:948 start_codon:yes stop_codon:yes gene_type:complete
MIKRLNNIIIILIVSLISSNNVFANDKITLLLDWFINPDHGPIIIANEKGIFKEEGLEIEIIPPANPADPPKLVAAGKADIAISYQPQLHMQIHEGLPVTRIGTLVATPLNCLLVLEDGPIKNLSDLKGKKIGYSISGMEQALLSAILKKAKVNKNDVEYINVNWSLSPSLMSKQVDAVIGAYRNFELNQMKIEGVKGRCFYIEEEGVPPYDELIFIVNNKNIDKEMLTKFLDSIEKATQYIINHPTESWKIFSNYSKELNNDLNKMAWYDTIPRFALRPAALDKRRYDRFENFLYEEGLIKEIFSFDKMAIEIY